MIGKVGSKNGSKIMVEGNVTCKFVNSELIYTRGIFRDITKNKYLEEQLFRLSSAVSMSTDCIVITDFDAKIIDANQKTLEMYGADSKEELIGKKIAVLVNIEPKTLKGEISHGMLLAAVTEEPRNVVILTVDKDMPNGSRIS
jgi:PAS domain-containing protein